MGNEAYAEDKLVAISGLTKNTNVWKINEKEVEKKLEELTEVKSATVAVEFPNNILITLNEWKRIAYIMKDGLFLPILENGDILEEQSGAIPVNSPILLSFSEGNEMEAMIDELNKIPVEVLNSISEIHLDPKETDPYHIKLFMNDGFEVSASIRSFSDKMAHYPSIVSQLDPEIKGVIDLEVGSFFKAYEWEGAEEENETEGEG